MGGVGTGLTSLRIEWQAKTRASVLDESDLFRPKGMFDGLCLGLHYRSSRAPGIGFTWQCTRGAFGFDALLRCPLSVPSFSLVLCGKTQLWKLRANGNSWHSEFGGASSDFC